MAKHTQLESDKNLVFLDMNDGDYEGHLVTDIFAIQIAYDSPELAVAFLRNGSKGKICTHGLELVRALDPYPIIEVVLEKDVYEYKDRYTRMLEAIEWTRELQKRNQSTIR